MYSIRPGHFIDKHRGILRSVALAYRRVMRAPAEPAVTRAEISRRDQKRQSEALAAATAEYRWLSPYATGDKLAVSGEVNRMIAEPTGAKTADPPAIADNGNGRANVLADRQIK